MSLAKNLVNSDFTIISTNEAASILSKFSPEMIDDIIDQALETKMKSYSLRLLNVVDSLEQNFKGDIAQFPQFANEIGYNRTIIYTHIINKVLSAHRIQLLIDINSYSDIYSLAYMIYELFIANFNSNVVLFFSNFIVKEKDMIYETLNLMEKKSELTNASYSKRLFKKEEDSKLAVIHANLEIVLSAIIGWDIDLPTFISNAYVGNVALINTLTTVLGDAGRFFNDFVVYFFKTNYAVVVTNIRFALQEYANITTADINVIGGQ